MQVAIQRVMRSHAGEFNAQGGSFPLINWLAEGARGLSPAYFALVMATGIVSIASDRAGFHTIAAVLLWLNAGQYLLLWILTAWRLLRYRRALLDDLTDHQAAPGFFSAVAATGVMGNQLIVTGAYDLALALWIFGLFLWIILTYAIFTTLTIKETKPTIDEGSWGVVALPLSRRNQWRLERPRTTFPSSPCGPYQFCRPVDVAGAG
jgi:hypothetical protein